MASDLEQAIVQTLVAGPLITRHELALALDRPPSTLHRALVQLRAKGWLAALSWRRRGRGRPTALYYLTAAGVLAAAGQAEPVSLSAHYGLGTAALGRRVSRLDHLVASRTVLLRLAAAVRDAGGVAQEWRAWPVRWHEPDRRRAAPWRKGRVAPPRRVELDGELHIVLPGAGGWQVALLYDGDPSVPVAALEARLHELSRLHLNAGLPTVLLVTCDPRRIPDALPPRLLWCAAADLLRDRLLTEPCWHGRLGARRDARAGARTRAAPRDRGGRTLGAALVDLGAYGRWGQPAAPLAQSGYAGTAPLCLGAPTGGARRDDGKARGTRSYQIHLAVPPCGWTILTTLAAHPLVTAAQLARLCMRPADRTFRRALAVCADHGLLTRTVESGQRLVHYALSRRGLRVLAQRRGLPARRYRTLYGAIADTGEDDHRLRAARRHLAHTRGVTEIYLHLRAAAWRAGARLWWRGEWLAWQSYGGRGGAFYLRPDACGVLSRGGERLTFFVEYDRGGAEHARLTTKLERYYAYGHDRGVPRVTVLVVTTPRRIGRWLDCDRAAEQRANGAYAEPYRLDLRVTTEATLAAGAALGPIWHTRAASRPVPLLGWPAPAHHATKAR